MASSKTVKCLLTGKEVPVHKAVPVRELRPSIRELLKERRPDAPEDAYLSDEALNQLRLERIQKMLTDDKREVTRLEKEVIESLDERRILSRDPLSQIPEKTTFGERIADKVASFGGSWAFIISFFLVLASWITINATALLVKPFDPFPFILLNLILSCLAAIQAPVIMMSQNRQEAKDRLRSEHDYQINLKAELEVRGLHEKLDRLIGHQWQQLLEIQQMQMDMIQESRKKE